MNSSDSALLGIGFTDLLIIILIVFVVSKLTGTIDWSWWWVLSPLWIGVIIAVILFGLGFLLRAWAMKIDSTFSEIDKIGESDE
ncbi:MAG: hypothetical protein P1R58_13545 [bacterium]|nr:hypothetical protein [bacterium]